jgi:hypothetical protein
MDIVKALTYAPKEKNRTSKLGLFVVVLLIPFLSLAGTGYTPNASGKHSPSVLETPGEFIPASP